LTSLCRSGDADDLARATLQHEEVTDADVVAWDGNSALRHFSRIAWFVPNVGLSEGLAARFRNFDFAFLCDGNFFTLYSCVLMTTVVMMMMTEKGWTVNWMGDTFGNTLGTSLNTTTETVVLSLVVVISHITLVSGWVYGGARSSFSDTNF